MGVVMDRHDDSQVSISRFSNPWAATSTPLAASGGPIVTAHEGSGLQLTKQLHAASVMAALLLPDSLALRQQRWDGPCTRQLPHPGRSLSLLLASAKRADPPLSLILFFLTTDSSFLSSCSSWGPHWGMEGGGATPDTPTGSSAPASSASLLRFLDRWAPVAAPELPLGLPFFFLLLLLFFFCCLGAEMSSPTRGALSAGSRFNVH